MIKKCIEVLLFTYPHVQNISGLLKFALQTSNRSCIVSAHNISGRSNQHVL